MLQPHDDYVQTRHEIDGRVSWAFPRFDHSPAHLPHVPEASDWPRPLMIYIAGPVTGRRDYNRPAFAAAADRLRRAGYAVFNPVAAMDDTRPLHEIMAYLIPQLCQCQGILMLPGWWRSGGARIEWALARYLGLRRIRL